MSTFTLAATDDASLDPELLDLITEALVWSDGAEQRARVLAAIVGCAVEAVEWRLEPDGDAAEERSLHQVLLAVDAHLERVRTRG